MIGAIVLAAGAGSRMGRDKATLRTSPGGPSFIDVILTTLQVAGVDVVRVVVAPGHELDYRHGVVNPDPAKGMLSSIHCGLNALGDDVDAVLIWPVDHPRIAPTTVTSIIHAFRKRGAPVVLPAHAGRRGHPVLFAASIFHELIAADPGEGARAVVHAHRDRLEVPVDDPGVLADIDTPDDYTRHFGSRTS